MYLDPKDLNVALVREHYTLLFVNDITANCAGATVFSTLDAEKAFYQIQLDEESSKRLTFNNPFGRYRYLRMPMGMTLCLQRMLVQLQWSQGPLLCTRREKAYTWRMLYHEPI